MKSTILAVLIITLFSCKKDASKSDVKPILLSRSTSNGITANRFYYNADNKLIRFESYDDQPGNALTFYTVIDYDGGGNIAQLTNYKEPGSVATQRVIVQNTIDGKIDSALVYDLQGLNPAMPTSSSSYNYNAQGQLIHVSSRDKNNQLLSYTNVLRYPDGTLKQIDIYDEESNELFLIAKTLYSIPGTNYPKGVESVSTILGEEYTALFFNESIQSYTYDQNGVIDRNTMFQMSAREYNPDGSLKKQVVTLKRIKPVFPDDITYKEYEYIN